jgi:hypothetical protein
MDGIFVLWLKSERRSRSMNWENTEEREAFLLEQLEAVKQETELVKRHPEVVRAMLRQFLLGVLLGLMEREECRGQGFLGAKPLGMTKRQNQKLRQRPRTRVSAVHKTTPLNQRKVEWGTHGKGAGRWEQRSCACTCTWMGSNAGGWR